MARREKVSHRKKLAPSVSPFTENRCPGCGSNKGFRALLICSVCWSKLPDRMKLEAYRAAKEDRQSIFMGKVAIEVLATLAQFRSPPTNPAPQARQQIRPAA